MFARAWPRIASAAERAGASEHRDEALRGLAGRVIELGAGAGTNFRHYPASVDTVLAVEPEPHLREHAVAAAGRAPVRVVVVAGTAGALPASAGSFDAAVVSLVLCSVPDQAEALAELHRVLRPGGELRLYEHVRAESAGTARLQRAVDIVWPLLAGGCHTSRDAVSALSPAGFDLVAARHFRFEPCVLAAPIAPHVIATARRRP